MKTISKFGMLLLAGVLGLMVSSCNKENEITPTPEPEYVTVNLGLAGEYLDIVESPITRAYADTSDLIAIKVYTLSDGNMESNYAYGVFSSLENVSIKLLAGQRYKFAASIMVDGNTPKADGLCKFNVPVGRQFIYSPSTNWYNFSFVDCTYSSESREEFKFDRFYGELAEYSPMESGTVMIETKRVAYGAHYIAEGLNEGHLKIVVNHTDEWIKYNVNLPSYNPESDGLYSFYRLKDAWQEYGYYDSNAMWNDGYGENWKLAISWEKEDGSVTPLGSYVVTFKRNIRSTIRIKVEDASTPNGIVIVRQDDELLNDSNEYVISGGNVVQVPVTQE